MRSMNTDLHFLTITEAAALIAARQLSPVELAQALLRRIEALDPQLDAFITVTGDLALDQARAAEREITSGHYRGPLHGIPFGLKDIYGTRDIPTANPEVGGSYLGPENTALYTRQAIAGIRGIMAALGMLDGSIGMQRQLHFGQAARHEVRPGESGYLLSHFEHADDLGKRVAKGTKLGEIVDIYSYEVLEELTAPVDGYLFFSRYSGLVGSGTQAFAIAGEAGAKWLN
jgi:predicted deacylase